MAFKLAEAYTELTTRDTQLVAGLSRARAMVTASVTSMQRTALKLTGLFSGGLGLLGIGAGVFGLKGLVDSALEAENAMVKLKSALLSAGLEETSNSERLSKLAGALQDAYNVSDDTLKSLMAFAIQLTGSADNMEDMTKAAIGLSAITGNDLQQSFEALVKYQQGYTTVVEKSLPVLKRYSDGREKDAKLNELLAKGLAQQKAEADSVGGSIQRLGVQFGELAEVIGGYLLPPLKWIVDNVGAVIRALTQGTAEAAIYWDRLTVAFLAFQKSVVSFVDKQQAREIQVQIEEMQDKISKAESELTNNLIKQAQEREKLNLKSSQSKEKTAKADKTTLEDIWLNAQKDASRFKLLHDERMRMEEELQNSKQGRSIDAPTKESYQREHDAAISRANQLEEQLKQATLMGGNGAGMVNTPAALIEKINRNRERAQVLGDILEVGSHTKGNILRWGAHRRTEEYSRIEQLRASGQVSEDEAKALKQSALDRVDQQVAKRLAHYAGQIAQEQSSNFAPRDLERQGLSGFLQGLLGLMKTNAPLKVEESPKLLTVLDKLTGVISKLNFGLR